MRRPVDNKLYLGSIWLLCPLIYLLNFCKAIYQCALMFVIISIAANAATLLCGKSRTLKGLTYIIMINSILLWKLPYYVDGKIINGLVFASLFSLMISIYWSTSVFQNLTRKVSFAMSSTLSVAIGAAIDGIVMGLFFAINNNFSYSRVMDIFTKELSYKTLYAILSYAIILIASNIPHIRALIPLGSSLRLSKIGNGK